MNIVKNVKPETIVIVKEDSVPVIKCPVRRVIKIYKGADEVVRVTGV